jgi:hypothetical protein
MGYRRPKYRLLGWDELKGGKKKYPGRLNVDYFGQFR